MIVVCVWTTKLSEIVLDTSISRAKAPEGEVNTSTTRPTLGGTEPQQLVGVSFCPNK
eukprot:SAG11_NODE_20275_length_449_cov_0.734286_1_plen_56_part_10